MLPVETKPAPEPLLRVQSFVNTVEFETGEDLLSSPALARPWLAGADLLPRGHQVTEAELTQVTAVRESLRALLVANAGGPAPGPSALAPLRALTAEGSARLRIDRDGTIGYDAAGPSDLHAGLFGLLLIARDAQLAGTWPLLKACADDECRWAFFDRSRNRGGTWCDMATCGNRAKNRAFRARRG
jgi:predicted RNA-binding Zn ribbon-like protein